jgi:multidrug transporter EmrE-like cation transporter
MWALGLLSLTIAACTVGLDQPPHWAQLDWPNGAPAWALLLAYCATITAAQLAFITSVQHLRASTAAILANAEIVFASIFGIFVLDQPTNGLAILGSLVIFAGCAVVAHGAVHGEANATASVTSEVEPLSDSSQRDEFEPPSEATMKRTGTTRGNGTRVRWLKIVRASRMGSR